MLTSEQRSISKAASGKRWKMANKVKASEAVKRWNAANPAKAMFLGTANSAKRRNYIFDLTVEWVTNKFNWGLCEQTGIPFELSGPFKASIDQINPGKGYNPDNCQMVCLIYQYAKHTYNDADVMRLSVELAKQQN